MMQELLLFGALSVGLYFLLLMTVLKLPRCKSTAKLHRKTAIVTGANTGIGKTTAMDLARRGARVILACRDRGRAEAAIQEIVQETGNNQVIFMQLDLASLKSVRSFADNFLRSESRLDLLINNVDFNCLTTHRDLVLGSNSFQLFQNYSHSKLCNILFTYELAKRLQGSDVTCYSLHPGQYTSDFY
ncbi:dehydrogenase/reductase SDR family member 13-like [Seriola lalandi dorsalis]|uniref:dehydrogenase/reductase SDR family member 13-like n=1 Tax=Seriola lalandi dorsalis TaxID=1841481 RepID=UPI000C6F5A82|nr:dehydrogenase/reductase SDR family member 13-like [Seriola lalandi dorsalis]